MNPGDIAHYPVKAIGTNARIEHWNVRSIQLVGLIDSDGK